ncbi:MAG: DUF4244 domain-containing protein [Brachybacterium sp.]|nr:DUF4244 domain-containing protein [Brachybacterium sp.]
MTTTTIRPHRVTAPPRDERASNAESHTAPSAPGGPLQRLREESGAATAEYAIATLAACGFAAVLVALLASGEVRSLLMNIITSALSMGS